jgi:hypothetical protein
MKAVNIDDFSQQLECTYKNERYSVRNNGAVLRHQPLGKNPRPTDNRWTFGKSNLKTGYMEIASVRVHRIVATGFHGNPPTAEHVVDHIDINRRNNRPENLRWLTRLENALLNPVTARKIELICGSIEAFLENPSLLHNANLERNYEWMRTVSPEEAKASLQRMLTWADSANAPKGGKLGEWIFRKNNGEFQPKETPQEELVMSLTAGAAQRNWRIPSEFPFCPQTQETDPLNPYAQKLVNGAEFSKNHFSETMVVKTAFADDHKFLWVLSEQKKAGVIKPWSLAQITYEDELYMHTSLGTFFDIIGAEKQMCLAQGLDWIGEDSIDDYC